MSRICAGLAALIAAVVMITACGSQVGAVTPADASSGAVPANIPSGDWPEFDYNAQRTGVGPAETGINGRHV